MNREVILSCLFNNNREIIRQQVKLGEFDSAHFVAHFSNDAALPLFGACFLAVLSVPLVKQIGIVRSHKCHLEIKKLE